MTAKRKVFTFYGTIIGISLAILFLFDLNLYAKVVLCTLILLCLLIMRSVKNAMVIPPNVDPDTMKELYPLDEAEPAEKPAADETTATVEAESEPQKTQPDSVDAYLKLLDEADKELKKDPQVNPDSPSYNNLLNEQIAFMLESHKRKHSKLPKL